MKKALSFDDVLLKPKTSYLESRNDVSVQTELCGIQLNGPLISANMPSVTNYHVCKNMLLHGCGFLSRFGKDQRDQAEEFLNSILFAPNGFDIPFGISVGIDEAYLNLVGSILEKLDKQNKWFNNRIKLFVCLDVAYANNTYVRQFAKKLKNSIGEVPLVIGNFATPEGIEEYLDLFSKEKHTTAFKVGVGSGAVCSTRIATGFGMPTLQSMLDIRSAFPDRGEVQLISDGGHKTSGDVVKSLAAGANAVMLGNMLAFCEDSPDVLYNPVEKCYYKTYYGNASKLAKKNWKYIEGESVMKKCSGMLRDKLREIEDGLRSGMSYCGAENLRDLYQFSEFLEITNNGLLENYPHAKL